VQILCLDAANGDEGVRESGRAQVKFTIVLRDVSRADTAWPATTAAADAWVVHEQSASGVRQAAPERATTSAQALQVAALARCVERSVECP
jgi:hypothetical protein